MGKKATTTQTDMAAAATTVLKLLEGSAKFSARPGDPKDWDDCQPEELGDWLEVQVFRGTPKIEIAERLGVDPDRITAVINDYVDQKRITRLFATAQNVTRAHVIAHSETIVRRLVSAMESKEAKDNPRLTREIAETLARFTNLKDIDATSILQDASFAPDPEIVKQFGLLDTLDGPKTKGNATKKETSGAVEAREGIEGAGDIAGEGPG